MDAHNADRVHAPEPTRLALRRLRGNELIQPLASALLHSFKAEAQVDGKFESERLVGLEDIQPAEDRALVVRRSTSNQSPGLIIHNKGEWFSIPAIALVSLVRSSVSGNRCSTAERGRWGKTHGLYVVVAVDKDGLLLGIIANPTKDRWGQL